MIFTAKDAKAKENFIREKHSSAADECRQDKGLEVKYLRLNLGTGQRSIAFSLSLFAPLRLERAKRTGGEKDLKASHRKGAKDAKAKPGNNRDKGDGMDKPQSGFSLRF